MKSRFFAVLSVCLAALGACSVKEVDSAGGKKPTGPAGSGGGSASTGTGDDGNGAAVSGAGGAKSTGASAAAGGTAGAAIACGDSTCSAPAEKCCLLDGVGTCATSDTPCADVPAGLDRSSAAVLECDDSSDCGGD